MVVGLSQAEGDFALPDARPERLLLITGGSGITPVISMLRTLCDEGHERPVTLPALRAAPSARRSTRRARARSRRGTRTCAWCAPTRASRRRRAGRPLQRRASARRRRPTTPSAETFVCGPPALIEAVRDALGRGRISTQRLHVERFVPPAPSIVLGEAEGADSLRAQRRRGRERRRVAARAGRGRRAHARVRLPHGHLPHAAAAARSRAASATRAPARSRRRRRGRSRSASRPRSATSRSSFENRHSNEERSR